MLFIGSENERAQIESLLESSEHEFLAIYCRRRIEKLKMGQTQNINIDPRPTTALLLLFLFFSSASLLPHPVPLTYGGDTVGSPS